MTRVLVAPDSFKGCLPAGEVARALALGLREASCTTQMPLADGGEGTVQACLDAGFRGIDVEVAGPTGGRVEATIAFDGTTAVVELADCCGLARLPRHRLAPTEATTVGVGEAILAALRLDPDRIVVGLGGSASTDGGTGLLSALGAVFTDANGAPVPLGGRGLARIARVDLSAAREALQDVELVGATDVTSPLTGAHGAAHVFGPQKGADPAQVLALDAGLANFAAHARFASDIPGAGAAGGAGYALLLLGATLVSGADFVLDIVGFDDALAACDVVITGEGRLDDQTLVGKLVGVVADRAVRAGRPVVAVVGSDGRSSPGPLVTAGGVAAGSVIALADLTGRSTASDPRGARAALTRAGRDIALHHGAHHLTSAAG